MFNTLDFSSREHSHFNSATPLRYEYNNYQHSPSTQSGSKHSYLRQTLDRHLRRLLKASATKLDLTKTDLKHRFNFSLSSSESSENNLLKKQLFRSAQGGQGIAKAEKIESHRRSEMQETSTSKKNESQIQKSIQSAQTQRPTNCNNDDLSSFGVYNSTTKLCDSKLAPQSNRHIPSKQMAHEKDITAKFSDSNDGKTGAIQESSVSLRKASEFLSKRIKELREKKTSTTTTTTAVSSPCKNEANDFIPQYSITPVLGQPLAFEYQNRGNQRQYDNYRRFDDAPSNYISNRKNPKDSSSYSNQTKNLSSFNLKSSENKKENSSIAALWNLLIDQLQGNPADYRLLYNPITGAFEGILSSEALQKLFLDDQTYKDKESVQKNYENKIEKSKNWTFVVNKQSDNESCALNSRQTAKLVGDTNDTDSSRIELRDIALPDEAMLEPAETASHLESQPNSQETIKVGGIRGIAVNRRIDNLSDPSLHHSWRGAINHCSLPDSSKLPSTQDIDVTLTVGSSPSLCNIQSSSSSTLHHSPRETKPSPYKKMEEPEQRNQSTKNQGKCPPFPHPLGKTGESQTVLMGDSNNRISADSLPHLSAMLPLPEFSTSSERKSNENKGKHHKNRYRDFVRGLKPSMIDTFPNSQIAGDVLWHATGSCESLPRNGPTINSTGDEATRYWEGFHPDSYIQHGSIDPLMQLGIWTPRHWIQQSYPQSTARNYPNYSSLPFEHEFNNNYYTNPSILKYYSRNHIANVPKSTRRQSTLLVDALPCLCID